MIEFRDRRPGSADPLPTNPNRSWRVRPVEETLGFAVHHTAGGDDPERTARYHVGANHTSAEGMPGLAYTFFIDKAGVITEANDLDQQTWSQGGGTVPDADADGDVDRDDGLGRANRSYIGIVLGGSFRSRWNDTDQRPTFKQHLALQVLIGHLVGEVRCGDLPDRLFGAVAHLGTGDVWPHAAFGKAACPGEDTEGLLLLMQAQAGGASRRARRSDEDWQRALKDRGYDLGSWGPAGDGVDGQWGGDSKRALVQFQQDAGLPATAERDPVTEAALFGG